MFKVKASELIIVLNELLERNIQKITISTYLGDNGLCSINLKEKKFTKIVTRNSWKKFLYELQKKHSLSNNTLDEIPNYHDILSKIITSGIYEPKGINELVSDTMTFLLSNNRKRIIIALDTNQLILNTMSNFVESFLSQSTLYENIRSRVNYALSYWVKWEKSQFFTIEKRSKPSSKIIELREVFKNQGYNLPEKNDKRMRLGHSIGAEIKA